jgi:hypothetical protein
MFFVEPGGNYWEIESYEHRYKAGLPYEVFRGRPCSPKNGWRAAATSPRR